jgi:hypothetical protein
MLQLKNFASDAECAELAAWVTDNKEQACFYSAMMGGKAVVTRYTQKPELEGTLKFDGFIKYEHIAFPKASYDVQAKVVDTLGLDALNTPEFYDGMYAAYYPVGDSICVHTDPVWQEGTDTLHCNIVVQAPEQGGVLNIDGVDVDAAEGDLTCYLVSKAKHSLSKIEGNKDRILWTFGFCVPHEQCSEF